MDKDRRGSEKRSAKSRSVTGEVCLEATVL